MKKHLKMANLSYSVKLGSDCLNKLRQILDSPTFTTTNIDGKHVCQIGQSFLQSSSLPDQISHLKQLVTLAVHRNTSQATVELVLQFLLSMYFDAEIQKSSLYKPIAKCLDSIDEAITQRMYVGKVDIKRLILDQAKKATTGKLAVMALLSTVAVFNVGAAPFDLSLETYNISLRDINEEAAKQMIRRPSFGQELTIYSSLANGFIHVKPGTTGARSLRIKNRRTVADNKLIRSWSDSYDSIVSFITRRALVPESITWEFTGAIERLAREGDELVARVVEEKDAAQFMLMRYPPLCGDAEVVEKPQFVQLMLVERHGGSYHRALLHAVYNRKGQVEMKFLQTSSEVGDECKRPESPSVLPGTLFMLSYD